MNKKNLIRIGLWVLSGVVAAAWVNTAINANFKKSELRRARPTCSLAGARWPEDGREPFWVCSIDKDWVLGQYENTKKKTAVTFNGVSESHKTTGIEE